MQVHTTMMLMTAWLILITVKVLICFVATVSFTFMYNSYSSGILPRTVISVDQRSSDEVAFFNPVYGGDVALLAENTPVLSARH